LLEVALQSGRTHQIRVHMAAIGHPVVGDARYGKPDRRLGSGRFFLHAFRVAFDHPVTGARMEFSAPLPTDLEDYLEGLPPAE
jgi:23S rRNA-/tRNA-specific pseudouridylate synthase